MLQKIEALVETSGCDEIITPFNFGGMPWAEGEKCLRLFAEKVLPIAKTFEPTAEVAGVTGRMDGQVGLVTGAASGIGEAVALRLGAEGATVVCLDVNNASHTVKTITEDGGTAESAIMDVTDAARWAQITDDVAARHGRIDFLVNVAGIAVMDPNVADTVRHPHRGVVRPGHRGEPEGVLAGHAGGHPAPARRRRRPDRQHQLAVQHHGGAGNGRLLRIQGRYRRPHPAGRRRVRAAQHPDQRRLPGGDQDPSAGRPVRRSSSGPTRPNT